jgi:phosphatidylserine decarboxylase
MAGTLSLWGSDAAARQSAGQPRNLTFFRAGRLVSRGPAAHLDAMNQAPDVTPDLPPRSWRALLRLLGRLPQGALSRSFGRVADIHLPPPLRRPVLGGFARAMGIDLSEAELPLQAYPTLNAFFVRRLRGGARDWPARSGVLASPVDGICGQLGEVRGGRILQAKGRWYSAAELLDHPAEAQRFEGGTFLTIYLSPRHYHRIHAPCAGSIRRARYVPGALLPVNAAAVAHVPDLFARNERLVCYLDGPLGRVAVVAVGAYNVGRISAAFDPAWGGPLGAVAERAGWATNRPGATAVDHIYHPPAELAMGDELMAFHLGSTVVLLTEPGRIALREGLAPGAAVRLGEGVGEGRSEK